MNDALSPCSQCARHVRVGSTHCPFCDVATPVLSNSVTRPAQRMGRAAMMAFGTAVLASSALTGCGGGEDGGSDHSTEHQRTESHVTAGDESTNSGGHGEDPNASHDPEGADGVHDDTSPQPHPDEGGPVAADDAPAPSSP